MSRIVYLTKEGLDNLKKELDRMLNVERPAISKMIGEAIDKGDISENAEYDAAKDAQGMLEAKIVEIQSKIAKARILDKTKIGTSRVAILNKVKIKNKNNNTVMQYMIVPEGEANLKEGKTSAATPIAKGLMGKKVGEVVEIEVPSGLMKFEIIEISI